MNISDDSKDFNTWFDERGFDEQHRDIFATVWDSAMESAKNELDDEWHWLLENLTSE